MSGIPVDLMRQVETRAAAEKEIVYYSEAGEVFYDPIPDRMLLFRTARKASNKPAEIKRLVVCDKSGKKDNKPGKQWFVPLAKKRNTARYHEILFSCQTIYELMDRYRISYEPAES